MNKLQKHYCGCFRARYTSVETTTRSGVLQPPVLRKMEWTRDIIFRFIELYRAHPLLWDPRNEHHKMKNKKSDAWTEISNCLNVEKVEVMRKMETLVGQFRQEIKKFPQVSLCSSHKITYDIFHKTFSQFSYHLFQRC